MVEGTEDALVRVAGCTGSIVATHGNGNNARHSPPGTTDVLCIDGYDAEHEIDYAIEGSTLGAPTGPCGSPGCRKAWTPTTWSCKAAVPSSWRC